MPAAWAYRLAVAAIALTIFNLQASAKLTNFDPDYDGSMMYILYSLDGVGEMIQARQDTALASDFNATQAKVKAMASAGTLTAAVYACSIDEFYTKVNNKYSGFSQSVTQKLDQTKRKLGQFLYFAPTYGWDFLSEQLLQVVSTFDDANLTSLFTSANTLIEKDIKNATSPNEIAGKFAKFLTKADEVEPRFTTILSRDYSRAIELLVEMLDASAEAANCGEKNRTIFTDDVVTLTPTTTTPIYPSSTTKPAPSSVYILVCALFVALVFPLTFP